MEGQELLYVINFALNKAGAVQAQAELQKLSAAGLAAAQKTDKSYKTINESISTNTRMTKDGAVTTSQMTQTVQNATGQQQKLTHAVQQTSEGMQTMNSSVRAGSGALKSHTGILGGVIGGYIKLAARALAVVPIWMAIRAVVQLVTKTIGSVVKAWKELDIGMQKVIAVTDAYNQKTSKTYDNLSIRARKYFSTTSRSMKEVTEAMYQLGTAGRSTEEVLNGFEHIMNLTVGTFGDVTTVGKTVSGMLNVFEKQLDQVGNTSQKVQYITDLMAAAWKNNQIELSEMSTAMSYLGAAGGALNIRMEELVAASSVMSDALLRGGKGGRILARAFSEIVKEQDKLKDIGVWLDPNAPLDFVGTLEQLHGIYEKNIGSMSFTNDLIDIFGQQGSRAVLAVLSQWEKFNEEIGRSPDAIKGMAKELKIVAESNWGSIVTRGWRQFWNKPDSLGTSWLQGSKSLAEGQIAREEDINNVQLLVAGIKDGTIEIDKMAASTEYLVTYLRDLGEHGLANKISGQTGVDTAKWHAASYAMMGPLGAPAALLREQDIGIGQYEYQSIIERAKERANKKAGLDSSGKPTGDYNLSTKEKLVEMDLKAERTLGRLKADNNDAVQIANQKLINLVDRYNQGLEYSNKTLEEKKKLSMDALEVQNMDMLALRRKGASEAQAVEFLKAQKELQEEIYEFTKKIDFKTQEKLDREKELTIARAMGLLNSQELIQLEIELASASMEYTSGMEKQIVLQKLQADLLSDQLSQVRDMGKQFENSFAQSLGDILKGDKSVTEGLNSFFKSIKDGMIESFAGGFADLFMKSTGFSTILGGLGVGIGNLSAGKGIGGQIQKGHYKGAQTAYQAIVKAFAVGSGMIKGGGGSSSFGASGGSSGSGLGGMLTTAMNKPMFQGTGDIPQYDSAGKFIGNKVGKMGGISLGNIGGSAMLGYSAYSNAQAGGVGKGQSIASGILVGAGGLALMGGVGMGTVGASMAAATAG